MENHNLSGHTYRLVRSSEVEHLFARPFGAENLF